MVLRHRRPLIFAHRGACAYAPENTLAAFELAIQQNADLIEVDTKLTADNQVVIIHDQTLDRTTDGSGRVADHAYTDLVQLNASNKYREQFPGEGIPRLEEVIELFSGRIHFNIELGNYFTPLDDLPLKVSSIISHYKLQDQVLVSSFHPIPLRRFQSLSPEIPIGFLARPGLQGYLSRSWLGRAIVSYDALHPQKNDVTPELIRTAHKFDRSVHTFTVNEPQEMAQLISLGVDGLITDDPLRAFQIIDASQDYAN